MKKNRFPVLGAVFVAGVSLGFSVFYTVFAFAPPPNGEQVGGSPTSDGKSKIKTIHDSLVSLSHGDEGEGSWGDWGVYWNRIRSAGEWVPEEGLAADEVKDGEAFYSGSREALTGTASLAPDYSKQSLQDWDDMKNYNYGELTPNDSGEDNTDEEATWTNTAGDSTTGVWKDGRTGLYWSANQGYYNDIFDLATCAFFTTTPRGNYDGSDSYVSEEVQNCGYTEAGQGGEGTTVSAINVCGQLSLDADGDDTPETDWYLPSQKELMQAYIDGIFNQTNATFTTYKNLWSSSEGSGAPSGAWSVFLPYGYTGDDDKSTEGYFAVRCVRRDVGTGHEIDVPPPLN